MSIEEKKRDRRKKEGSKKERGKERERERKGKRKRREKKKRGKKKKRTSFKMATADWLVYSPEHKVIICKIHGFAISALSSYLSRQHANLSCRVRNTIIAEYNTLELDCPSDANFQYGPANPTTAINGLTIYKGLACRDFQQCRVLSTSWKRLKVYYKKEH